ncbi:hypothetical protein JCM33374_g4748 [Metschnikowia sp. JCM 33374]|nr:hypothetical protein JCM33374_g4748 [Metschnikowia sp. JCM 33374]
MTTVPSINSPNSSPSPEASSVPGQSDKKHTTKLSTSSPEAIRVASEITPNRLANLLIRKGPLAIRLITSQLSIEVPGFDLLSLSKQRRLIMAAMEQGDPENDVVFEKIGWGQWAVRHVNSDYIVTEPNGSLDGNARVNIHELKEKAKLGWSKKSDSGSDDAPAQAQVPTQTPTQTRAQTQPQPQIQTQTQTQTQAPLRNVNPTKRTSRRDSISNHKSNLHNFRLPGEKLESQANGISESEQDSDEDEDEMDRSPNALDQVSNIRDLKMRFINEGDDNAIDEDSDEDIMEEEEEEESLFKFEDDDHGPSISKFKKSQSMKFANRVPTKFSPPPALSGTRRKSSSAAAPNSIVKNTSLHNLSRHQLLNRSRLNSIENLDDYILSSARNSSISVSSPAVQNSSLPSTSPLGSWNGKSEYLNQQELPLPADHISSALQNVGRRKSSFNESSIRSTLSSSLPRGHSMLQRPYENGANSVSSSAVVGVNPRKGADSQEVASDTDEEDWASMGAETLRSHSVGMSSPARNKLQSEERTAARALVDLMGI